MTTEKRKQILQAIQDRVAGYESLDKSMLIADLLDKLSCVDLEEIAEQQGVDI